MLTKAEAPNPPCCQLSLCPQLWPRRDPEGPLLGLGDAQAASLGSGRSGGREGSGLSPGFAPDKRQHLLRCRLHPGRLAGPRQLLGGGGGTGLGLVWEGLCPAVCLGHRAGRQASRMRAAGGGGEP